MARFPPPNDELFVSIDGKAVTVDSLKPDTWRTYKAKLLKDVGRMMSAESNGDSFKSDKKGWSD